MNVQLHYTVTNITGPIGLAMLDTIVAGERDLEALARLRDYRCKKSEAEIAKALRGDWREEHLFTFLRSPFHLAPIAGGLALPSEPHGRL